MRLIENDNGWNVGWSEARLSRIQIDFRVCLDIRDSKEGVATLCIETDFYVTENVSRMLITPGNVSTLVPILQCFNKSVDWLKIGKSGELLMKFNDGLSIEVAPHERYEAWQLSLSTNVLLVCSPGGNVAVFQKDLQQASETMQ